MARSPFVFHFVGQALELATQSGVASDALLESVGWTAATVGPEVSSSAEQVEAFLAEAALRTGRPSFGIDLARSVVPGSLGWLEYAVVGNPTVEAGYEMLAKFSALLNQSASFSYARVENERELHYETTNGEALGPQLAEFVIAMVLLRTQRALGTSFVPCRAWLPGPMVTSPAVLDLLRCEVRFDAETAGFAITAADAARPVPGHDPNLHALLVARLGELLPIPASSQSVTSQVRVEILARLGHRSIELAHLAAALRTTPRTLQRNLAREGTSLANVIDDARRARAEVLLARIDLSIGQVADLLGYADPSGFERAYRRWTGRGVSDRTKARTCTPSPHRSAHRASHRTIELSLDTSRTS